MTHADAVGGVLVTFGVVAFLLALSTAAGFCTAAGPLFLLIDPHREGNPS